MSPLPRQTLTPFRDFALELADASGAIIRAGFRKPHSVEVKDDLSPVTDIDKAVETTIREMIAARFPEHGIMGEEFDDTDLDAELVWVIDPVDGTKQFAAGLPTFATLIALARDGVPILGIIDQPVTAERWIGLTGEDTTFNGAPIHTRPCANLAEAVLATAAPDYFLDSARHTHDILVRDTLWPLYGAGCHAYGQMAMGYIDIGVEASHNAFDFCALVPVVQGAGGVISDWQGKPLTIHSDDRFIAAGDSRVHQQALELIETALS